MPLAHGATFEFAGEEGQVSWRADVASCTKPASHTLPTIGAHMRRVSGRRRPGELQYEKEPEVGVYSVFVTACVS